MSWPARQECPQVLAAGLVQPCGHIRRFSQGLLRKSTLPPPPPLRLTGHGDVDGGAPPRPLPHILHAAARKGGWVDGGGLVGVDE